MRVTEARWVFPLSVTEDNSYGFRNGSVDCTFVGDCLVIIKNGRVINVPIAQVYYFVTEDSQNGSSKK